MTLLLFLPGPAAQAGSWTYVITGDNTGTSFTDNGNPGYAPSYSPASSGNGSGISIPGYTITRQNNGPSGAGCSITVIIHVQVTFTWQPAAGQTMTTDPPPPNVLVLETANTGWSANGGDYLHICYFGGSASDGLGDAEYDDPSQQTPTSGSGSSASPSNYDPNSLIGEHLTHYPASSGTVTIPQRTLKAAASTSYLNQTEWYYGASASVGSYTAMIHPQPYNWHITSVTPGPAPSHGIVAGELEFLYAWSSTSGNIADLTNCYFHELVTYPGPNPFTVPPPFSWPNPLPNGVPEPGSGAQGLAMTDLANGRDVQHIFTPVQPYFVSTLSATQLFQFDDTATGETNITIPGTDNSDTILRSVATLNGNPPWYYTVSKSNNSTTVALAP